MNIDRIDVLNPSASLIEILKSIKPVGNLVLEKSCFIEVGSSYLPEQVKQLEAITEKNAEIEIDAEISYEADMYCEIHVIKIARGKTELVTLKSSHTCSMGSFQEYDTRLLALREKVFEICRRIDSIKIGADGKPFIDWIDDEITLSLEKDGLRAKFCKKGLSIDLVDVSLAREVKSIVWEPVFAQSSEYDSPPF